MARKYVRDNRGRFASVGATARGGRLRTAAGNKRATQTRKINARPAGTINKPKGLQPGAIKPTARRSPATSPLRPGELMNAVARPVGTVARFTKTDRTGFTNRRGGRDQNIATWSKALKKEGLTPDVREKAGTRRRKSGNMISVSDVPAYAEFKVNRWGTPTGEKQVVVNRKSPAWQDPVKDGIRNRREGWLSSSDPRGSAFHEAAHLKYPQKHETGWYAQAVWRPNERIAKRVSGYAATKRDEFVSEVYAGLKTGRKYDFQVMRLFRKEVGLPERPAARRRSRIRRKP